VVGVSNVAALLSATQAAMHMGVCVDTPLQHHCQLRHHTKSSCDDSKAAQLLGSEVTATGQLCTCRSERVCKFALT
jgi:hypothetical protein